MTKNKKLSRQEMIDSIYEKIARKDLSFGCKCWVNEPDMPGKMIYIGTEKIETLFQKKYVEAFWCESEKKILYERYKIIGHPVMIGDVLDYFQENPIGIFELYGVEFNSQGRRNLPKNIFILWKNKRKPIEEQSDDCIEFVYNLIS